MQRTLRRELKGTEIAEREVAGPGSLTRHLIPRGRVCLVKTLMAVQRQPNLTGPSSSLVGPEC